MRTASMKRKSSLDNFIVIEKFPFNRSIQIPHWIRARSSNSESLIGLMSRSLRRRWRQISSAMIIKRYVMIWINFYRSIQSIERVKVRGCRSRLHVALFKEFRQPNESTLMEQQCCRHWHLQDKFQTHSLVKRWVLFAARDFGNLSRVRLSRCLHSLCIHDTGSERVAVLT